MKWPSCANEMKYCIGKISYNECLVWLISNEEENIGMAKCLKRSYDILSWRSFIEKQWRWLFNNPSVMAKFNDVKAALTSAKKARKYRRLAAARLWRSLAAGSWPWNTRSASRQRIKGVSRQQLKALRRHQRWQRQSICREAGVSYLRNRRRQLQALASSACLWREKWLYQHQSSISARRLSLFWLATSLISDMSASSSAKCSLAAVSQ